MLHAQAGLHVCFVCIRTTERETCPGRYVFAERCWRCRADVALGVDIVMVGCAWSGCYTGLWTESVGGVDQMGYLSLKRLWASNAELGCWLSIGNCVLVRSVFISSHVGVRVSMLSRGRLFSTNR